MTNDLSPTLDSRYSENVAHITNRIAAFLNIFGIGIKLHTDHIFLDKDTASSKINCFVLTDRVSDHSPIECIINYK